ncbi:hypothetical protein [Streptomyces virginiae]|uniref:hypothetical protein n=1 Tax=Streptomyces virginiae TaxID=1961 RepID=UPI0033332FCC
MTSSVLTDGSCRWACSCYGPPFAKEVMMNGSLAAAQVDLRRQPVDDVLERVE